ncbi:hypothetical protein CKAH01_16712 [Colletotrichum kahawae]|uniref:DUF6594 domain-containing protein n=1 Tax=Colletotrichum kahawae TaxID=34407 RepID=A0AAD9YCV0_COLKA|nr:hypothetical protein CKAH01_16712 [Colletotrichum kahawae]
MGMETFSLIDDEKQSSLRTDLTLPEIYKTRLLRADLGTRTRTDPFERWIHQCLRAFRYRKLSMKARNNTEDLGLFSKNGLWSHQNSIMVAAIAGRVITALMIGVFLVVPLAILSADLSRNAQLAIVSACILILSVAVATMLRASNFEMIAVSAAYAAVLSVFISNGSEVKC